MSALCDLELFSIVSALKLNNEKTEALWTDREDQLCPKGNLKWENGKVKPLGFWISIYPRASRNADL